MICIKANIPKKLSDIDDELKAIYRFKSNEFVERTQGMLKIEQEKFFQKYQS